MALINRLKTSLFVLDLRALALFRIGLGLVFLLDLLLRARDLQMFYGDGGVLSRDLFLKQSWLLSEYQVFLATGSSWGLSLFFLLGAAAGACLVAGFRTRYAAFFCWVFTVSLQLRNPIVLDGGDELLRLLLFWCPFLPLAARWSVEARSNLEWAKLPNDYRSVATVGVTLQYALLYFFAGLLKTGTDWKETGEALYYTLSIDQFATHLGKALLHYQALLEALSPCIPYGEMVLSLLLLVPICWVWPRYLFFILALGFHVGIALTLHFGIFMLIAVAGLVVFIPGQLLDRWGLSQVSQASESQPPGYSLTRLEQTFGVFILFYMVFVNVQSIQHRHRLPGWTMAVARLTYQHQHWHLFAPMPFREDGWFVFEVTDRDGRVWRSLGSDDIGLEKPGHVSTTFPNQRWRRWFQNLVQEPFQDTQSWRNSTAEYLAGQWLRDHPRARITSYRLLFMEEMTPPPGEEATVEMKVLAESVKS